MNANILQSFGFNMPAVIAPCACLCCIYGNWLGECRLPVCCQPGGYVPSRDLCHDVAPEKRSVNHPHRLRVPVELGFLVADGIMETKKQILKQKINKTPENLRRSVLHIYLFGFSIRKSLKWACEWIYLKAGFFVKGLTPFISIRWHLSDH